VEEMGSVKREIGAFFRCDNDLEVPCSVPIEHDYPRKINGIEDISDVKSENSDGAALSGRLEVRR
jgi:hypothetical protein